MISAYKLNPNAEISRFYLRMVQLVDLIVHNTIGI